MSVIAFSELGVVGPAPKPRDRGLTMMIDWGLPLGFQEDVLDIAAEVTDLAKIAVGLSGLLPEGKVKEKIARYRNAAVEPFPGGMFAEKAFHRGSIDYYFEECRRLGYELIEISDNVVHLEQREREGLIKRAIDEYGLRVIGEVGSKHEKTAAAVLAADAAGAIEAGAWKVFVEAAEFMTPSGFDMGILDRILQDVALNDLIFELPGPWISDVHHHDIHGAMVALIAEFGSDVNVANVSHESLWQLQTLRSNIGVAMTV